MGVPVPLTMHLLKDIYGIVIFDYLFCKTSFVYKYIMKKKKDEKTNCWEVYQSKNDLF